MKARKVEDFVKIKCVPPHDIIGQEIKRHLPQGVPAQVLLKLMEKSAKSSPTIPSTKSAWI